MTEGDAPGTQNSLRPGRHGLGLRALRWAATSVAGVLGALVLIVTCVVALEIPVELDWLRGRIETAASEAVGRRIAIEGPVTLVASFPPEARIEGVHVGNPQGWPEADLAHLALARVELQILPLLQGEVVIEEISVKGLEINLETNAAGEPNWVFSRSRGTPPPQTGKQSPPPALKFVELAELSLRDIIVSHRDAAADKRFEFKLDEVTGSAEHGEPMRLVIHGSVQALPYELGLTAGSLMALGDGKAPWPLDLSGVLGDVRLRIAGVIAEPLRAKGFDLHFDLSAASAETLEGILATKLPPIGSFAVAGRLEETEGRYRLANIEGKIAATAFTASLEADTAGEKPRLVGDIEIERLDVGPLFEAISEQGANEAKTSSKPDKTDSTSPDKGRAAADRNIDIDVPILTLEALNKFDAHFGLTVQEVVNAPASVKGMKLQVVVNEGKLSSPLAVTLAEVPFKGNLSLGAAGGQPNLAVSLSGQKSDIGGLAALLSGAQDLEGQFGFAQLGFSARGATIRSLVESAELRCALKGASLSYGHDSGDRPVEFTLDEAQLSFPAAEESRITAQGSLLGEAFALEFKGGTFLESFVQKRWHLELLASGGGAELSVRGTARPTQADSGTELDFGFRGGRIGALAAWLGVAPQATQSYALKGRVAHTGKGIAVRVDEARIGNSAFAGTAGIRKEGDTAITFAKLAFEVLDLPGLASLLPEEPDEPVSEPHRVGPETLKIDVPILPHGIELSDSDIQIALTRVTLEHMEITNASVSATIRDGYVRKAPIAATVAGAEFDGGLGIDLRGELPTIDLRLHSSRINAGAVLSQLGLVEDMSLTAGSFDLHLALQGASRREMLQRSSLRATVRDGAWALTAPGAQQSLNIRIPEAVISADPRQPITLAIDGRIEQIPLQIQVSTEPLGSFAEAKQHLQMDVAATLAKASLTLSGTASLPVRGDDLHFALDLSGGHLSDFDELLNVELPPIGSYRLRGEFGSRSSGYYVQDLALTVGDSTFAGKLDLDTTRLPPRLDLALLAPRIQLDDFDTGDWSASGEVTKPRHERPAPGDAEVKLDAPRGGRPVLSPEVMRSLDAKVEIRVDEVLSGADHLGRGDLTATLESGRFSVDPLTLEVPGGSVALDFALAPTVHDVALEVGARVDKLDYGILARRIDPASQTGGVISVDLDLHTRGPDLQHVMQGSNGHLDFAIWPKDLNAGVFELWAVNVITALVKEVDKEEGSKVNCVIARFQIDDGVMQDRVVFADTTRMRVEGSAQVDFKQRVLQVRAAPSAKRPEFFSLAVPVGLTGPFDDFHIKINPVVLTGKALAFVTSPLHVPVRRIFKKGEPSDGTLACAEAWGAADRELRDEEQSAPLSPGDNVSGGERGPQRGPKYQQPPSLFD